MSNEFQNLLRLYRHKTYDFERKLPLTQERFGKLIEREGGGKKVSGQSVYEWERGISKPERPLLINLIKVLWDYGGLEAVEEANYILLAGLYQPLSDSELREILARPKPELSSRYSSSLTETFVSGFLGFTLVISMLVISEIFISYLGPIDTKESLFFSFFQRFLGFSAGLMLVVFFADRLRKHQQANKQFVITMLKLKEKKLLDTIHQQIANLIQEKVE